MAFHDARLSDLDLEASPRSNDSELMTVYEQLLKDPDS